jgi:hypothetical protein
MFDGWDHVPPTDGTDINAWQYLYQFDLAIKERNAAIGGGCLWPPHALDWFAGSVDSVEDDGTSVTITCVSNDPDDPTPDWSIPGECSGTRWVNYECPDACYLPSTYRIVIDCNPSGNGFWLQPQYVVSAIITSNNETGTLTVDSKALNQWVTFGNISSVDDLADCPCYIIKEGLSSWWWSDRCIPCPPSWLFAWGEITASDDSSLTDSKAFWVDDRWITPPDSPEDPGTPASYDVLFEGDDSQWHRATITGNTAHTLSFGTLSDFTPAIGGRFGIIGTDELFTKALVNGDLPDELNRAGPVRASLQAFMYYGGYRDNKQWTHGIDDDLTTTKTPALTYRHGCEGDEVDTPVFDVDFQYEINDECDCTRAGDYIAQYFWATWRSIQLWIEDKCSYFIDPSQDYDGWDKRYIPHWSVAELFYSAGVGQGWQTTVSGFDGSGNPTFSPLGLETPIELYYAITHHNGSEPVQGSVTITTDGVLPIGIGNDTPPLHTLVGETLTLNTPWTAHIDREIQHIKDSGKTVFVPDYDEGDDPENPMLTIYDPPVSDSDNPERIGSYITRDKSAGFREFNSQGFVGEGPDEFTDGDLARYVGDNENDPSLDDVVLCNDDRVDCQNPETKYRDNFYTGQYHKEYRNQIRAFGARGRATEDGETFKLTDDNANLWLNAWALRENKLVTITHSGTASGGSTTTLEDEAQDDNEFWLQDEGHIDGWILEITSGENAGDNRPIVSHSGTTLTVSPAFEFAIADGDDYEIKNSYEKGRYNGLKLRLWLDGTASAPTDTVITAHDNTTLFFTAVASPVTEKTKYQIIEPKTGDVLVYSEEDDEWVFETGVSKWYAGNHPDEVVRYHRYQKGDIVTETLFGEIRACLDLMVWTLFDPTYTNKPAEDDPPELNELESIQEEDVIGWTAGVGTNQSFLDSWHRIYDQDFKLSTWPYDYANYVFLTDPDNEFTFDEAFGAPQVKVTTGPATANSDNTEGEISGNIYSIKRYAYMRGEFDYSCTLNFAVDWFVYPEIDEDDTTQDLDADYQREFETEGGYEYHTYKKIASSDASTDLIRRAGGDNFKIGPSDVDVPPVITPMKDPVDSRGDGPFNDNTGIPGEGPTGKETGYYLVPNGVKKWDVDGGFRFRA